MNDFEIIGGRMDTVYTVYPLTEDAREFAETAFSNAQRWCDGYAVGHRYIKDVMYDLVMNQGFAVSWNGRDILGMEAA